MRSVASIPKIDQTSASTVEPKKMLKWLKIGANVVIVTVALAAIVAAVAVAAVAGGIMIAIPVAISTAIVLTAVGGTVLIVEALALAIFVIVKRAQRGNQSKLDLSKCQQKSEGKEKIGDSDLISRTETGKEWNYKGEQFLQALQKQVDKYIKYNTTEVGDV